MSDIVERLRYWNPNPVTFSIVCEAADEIERLQSQLADAERERDHHRIQELRLAKKLAEVERERDALRKGDISLHRSARPARKENKRGS